MLHELGGKTIFKEMAGMEKGFNKRKNESHNQAKIKGIYSTASAREKFQGSGNILQGRNYYGF